MIPVTLLMVRVDTVKGIEQSRFHKLQYLAPERIDTISEIDEHERKAQHLPDECCSMIRYVDTLHGYRLLFVAQVAGDVAQARMRAMRGEDPDTPWGPVL